MPLNKRTNLWITALLLTFIACNKPTGNRLPLAKMAQILTDIQMAEVYSTMVKKAPQQRGFDRNMDSLALYYKEIFAHYNITQQQFDESIQWYKAHPDEMDSIYVKMLPEFSKYN